jgi:hypothetical protein
MEKEITENAKESERLQEYVCRSSAGEKERCEQSLALFISNQGDGTPHLFEKVSRSLIKLGDMVDWAPSSWVEPVIVEHDKWGNEVLEIPTLLPEVRAVRLEMLHYSLNPAENEIRECAEHEGGEFQSEMTRKVHELIYVLVDGQQEYAGHGVYHRLTRASKEERAQGNELYEQVQKLELKMEKLYHLQQEVKRLVAEFKICGACGGRLGTHHDDEPTVSGGAEDWCVSQGSRDFCLECDNKGRYVSRITSVGGRAYDPAY